MEAAQAETTAKTIKQPPTNIITPIQSWTNWEGLFPQKGWLFDYINYAEMGTDAPRSYHLFNGFGVLGLAIGRRAWIPWGHNRIFGNFYLCNIGKSTFSRKSTSQTIGRSISASLDEDRVYSDRFTPEAILKDLETGQIMGIWSDEIGALFQLMEQKEYMSGLKGDLVQLYGCPDFFTTSRAQKKYRARDVFVSLIGATTPDWINDYVKGKDIRGGFYVRFLFIPEIPKTLNYDIPPRVPQDAKNKIVMNLRRITEKIRGEYILALQTQNLFIEWKRRIEKIAIVDPEVSKLAPFYARLEEYALKFAMLLEASEGIKGSISPEKMYQAIEIAERLRSYTNFLVKEEFVSDSPYERNMKRIKDLVKKYPGQNRKFYQQRAHMRAGDFNPAWDSCKAEGWIHYDREKKVFQPG